jgi:hypothetical protein
MRSSWRARAIYGPIGRQGWPSSLALEIKIPVVTMAEVLGATPCAIAYRSSHRMQETSRHHKARANAAREGWGWPIPKFQYQPRPGLYTAGQVVQILSANTGS